MTYFTIASLNKIEEFKYVLEENEIYKYDKINKTVRPYWDRFMKTEDAIEKAFIEQKLYIIAI